MLPPDRPAAAAWRARPLVHQAAFVVASALVATAALTAGARAFAARAVAEGLRPRVLPGSFRPTAVAEYGSVWLGERVIAPQRPVATPAPASSPPARPR